MPNTEVKGLRGLKSFSSLSTAEYNKWKRDNSKYLGKYSSYKQEEELYNTQRFADRYGKDVARQYTYDQRITLEKQDVEQYNNSLRKKTAYDTWNPFNEDGTVDPNKGVGSADTFYKLMNMEPMFQQELLASDWLTEPELNSKIKTKQKENFDYYSDPRVAGTEAGAAGAFSYFMIGRDVDEKIDRGGNKNIFDKIYAKDLAHKANQSEGAVREAYNSLEGLSNEEIDQEFIRAINPVKNQSLGVPQLAAFYDKDGNIRSSEVDEIGTDEKKQWIAKIKVYNSTFDPGTAYDMLDKQAKDYIDDHQSWSEYSAALGKDMLIGASAYTADKINGIRAAYLSFDNEKVPTYVDDDGHFWGSENLKRNEQGQLLVDANGKYTYIDPYSGESIKVRKTEATKSALDAQGIAPDGTTRGLFFNNRYWSDAESTGMWGRDEHARAKELNGYSPSKAVYKFGEDKDYLWEVAKMGQFALADMATNLIPIGGGVKVVGSGFSMLGKVSTGIKGLNTVSKTLTTAGTGLIKAAPSIKSFTTGTVSAFGISHAYGRGRFGEDLSANMLEIDNKLLSDASNNFHTSYNSNDDFKALVDSEVNSKLQSYLAENSDAINSMSDSDRAEFISSLTQQIRNEVANQYISDEVGSVKDSPEYLNYATEAAESASSSASTAAWTTGLKYALVNNFGHRRFLFRDPLKRSGSQASKVIGGATEGANKRLSIIERFKNGTKGFKAKEVGKITLSQMWGGAWTNWTDELQSAGAGKMNKDRMAKYLNGDYDAEGEASLMSSIGSAVGSYLEGARGSITDASTWNAGLVGALGSITSFAPNVMSMKGLVGNSQAAKKARAQLSEAWNSGNYMEVINSFVSNGILNGYYDKVLGERQAKDIIDQVNSLLDNYDDFKGLSRGIALDMASMDATNPHDSDALDYLKAAQIAYTLHSFSSDRANSELIGAAMRSSVFSDALSTIDKITNGNFTQEDAKNYLTEYYARNPFVTQSDANNSRALEVIKSNAEKLKTGVEVFSKVDEILRGVEESTGKSIAPNVRARLVERYALDQFLTDRIAEVEANISGSQSVTAGTVAESYGNDRALGSRIGDLTRMSTKLASEIEKAKAAEKEKSEKVEKFKTDKFDDEIGDVLLTDEEKKTLAKLQAEADAASMQVRALEELDRSTSEEKSTLENLKNSTDRRVLSSEEILKLSPEDRARMLNDSNFKDYSKAQQLEITKARSELALRDPSLLDDVQHQAIMVQRRRANATSYSMMLENPEAAAAQLDADALSEYYKYQEVVKRRRAEVVNDFIRRMEEAPSMNTEEFEEILSNQLKGFGIGKGIDMLKEIRDSNFNRIQRYSHVFDGVIDTLETQSDIKGAIDSMNLEEAQKNAFIQSVSNIVGDATGRQAILDNIGKAYESPDVSNSDKRLLGNLLSKIEEIWNQKASTTTTTRKEREAAQQESQDEEAQREAARLEAEKKAAELAVHGLSDNDSDTSQDRDAELQSRGLTEEDLKTNKEAGLSESEITKGVNNGEEFTLEEEESPTLEEQVAADPERCRIIETPKDDATDQGNKLPETVDNFQGNIMYGYELGPLKGQGIQQARKGKSPTDKMSRYFAWMEAAGVKMQDIIDQELNEIAQLDQPVYPLYVDYHKNATNDDALSDFMLLAVEYTDDVKAIHNDKLGGVVTSNGKQYLIVGTMGFAPGNKAQGDAYRQMLYEGKVARKQYLDANPSERFFVDTSRHTGVQQITSGRLVRQLSTDSEVKIRSISELLADEARNPKGLTIADLKWGIQYDAQFVKVNVSDRNTVYPPSDGTGNVGSVFLLVETSNGNYIPAYIKPTRLSEIKDGSLKNQIEELINELTSPKHEDRVAAEKKLKQLLNLTKKGDWVLLGTKEMATVTVQKNGVKMRSFNLTDPAFNRSDLLQSIYELDPRINITVTALSDPTGAMQSALDEAGALTTDLALLGTSGASYTVYSIDAEGNPIITAPAVNVAPSTEVTSDLAKAERKKNSEAIGNITYRKDENGQWRTDTDKPVTDERLIEQLNYKNLIRTMGLQPSKVNGQSEIFIVNSSKDSPLVIIRQKGKYYQKMTKEGALRIINEVNAEQVEKERQERLKQEIEKEERTDNFIANMTEEQKREAADSGGDVNLFGEGETLTDDQIVNQQLGDFEAKPTPQQETAEKLVEKITTDTSDIQLSEDGKTYVDSNGKHYARVTSVIAADESAGERFGENNPWGLPSTTIGTGIDGFVRDYFDNKLGNPENLAERYPNATNEQLQAFIKQLDNLKEEFKRRGLTIVPRDVTVSGTVEVATTKGEKRVIDVAGTLDLLAYDKDGNFYIFDMKTNRSAPNREKGAKWAKQLTLYKQLLQAKYGAVVKGMEIIPIQVSYPAPKGYGNATTEYTAREGRLYADGTEYKDARPTLHNNIPISEIPLKVQFSRLTPSEQAMVRTLEDVKPTPRTNTEAPIVQQDAPKTGEDINGTGTKSLAQLQAKKTLNTALAIMMSKEYGKRVRDLLKAKFPDFPKKTAEIESFLQSKKLPTVNISNVEDWIALIEECR